MMKKEITDEEAVQLKGGAGSFSAALLNYLGSFIKTIYEIGQNLGSSFRRKC